MAFVTRTAFNPTYIEEYRGDPLSRVSLSLQLFNKDKSLGYATGFLYLRDERLYLITNWHVLSGRDAETNKPMNEMCILPDTVEISCHHKANFGQRVLHREALLGALSSDGEQPPLWLENPLGRRADVVALPIGSLPPSADIYPLPEETIPFLGTNTKPPNQAGTMYIGPGMPVSIVGYPELTNTNKWPVWKTGHIASEPFLSYDEDYKLPAYLIDATTRHGMSGSPVFARQYGNYINMSGEIVDITSMKNVDGLVMLPTRFVGVYSGRLGETSEIGRVWVPKAVNDIFTSQINRAKIESHRFPTAGH